MGDSSDKRGLYVKYCVAGLVALVTLTVYLPSLRNGFVNWDDTVYVYQNQHILALNARFLRWAFFDFYGANWHPLTWLSLAADQALWGMNPLGYHLTNILLHAANTFLVVLLAAGLVRAYKGTGGNVQAGRTTLVAAGITGLLFGLHPLHVESVAWVSERKDLLCALFFLLSIMSYMSSRTNTSQRTYNRHYLLSLAFFGLALMSKPMAVSLPLILLVLDWFPFKRIYSFRTFRISLVEKIPFVALSLASCILTIMAQKSVGAVASLEYVPLSSRLLVGSNSLLAYLWKMVFPLNLLPFYSYPKLVSLVSYKYLFSVAAIIGITAACVVSARRQRLWLAIWGVYVVMLLPVLGIVQVGIQSMADRYTYLPSLGPFLLAGLFAERFVDRSAGVSKTGGLFLKIAGSAVVLLVFASLSYATVRQIGIWKDGITLWSSSIRKEGNVALFYKNLGVALQEQGRLNEAVSDFDRAIALVPSFYQAYNDRGLAFYETGRFDEAVADYDKVIALKPSYYRAYINRGLAYSKKGFLDRAIADYEKAIALAPADCTAYFDEGVAFGRARMFDKATEYLDKAIVANPYYYDAYFNRGLVWSAIGRDDRAMKDFSKAIALNPDYAMVYFYRGNLFIREGDVKSAFEDFRSACALRNELGCEALQTYGAASPNAYKTP